MSVSTSSVTLREAAAHINGMRGGGGGGGEGEGLLKYYMYVTVRAGCT